MSLRTTLVHARPSSLARPTLGPERRPERPGSLVRNAMRRAREAADVEELLMRYLMAIYDTDRSASSSCFAEGVEVRFAPPLFDAFESTVVPHEWAALARRVLASDEHCHRIHSVRVDGDEATAIGEWRAGREGEPGDGPAPTLRYEYRCRRGQGGWQIAAIMACIPSSGEAPEGASRARCNPLGARAGRARAAQAEGPGAQGGPTPLGYRRAG